MQNLNVLRNLDHAVLGCFVKRMLGLDIAYLCTKFDNSSFSHFIQMIGSPKKFKWATWPDHAPLRDGLSSKG